MRRAVRERGARLLGRLRRRWWPRARPAPAIHRWDLDKTYLKTDFESLRHMAWMPFESAKDKVDEPGVVPLIRALRQAGREASQPAGVYFLTASPPQIGRAIREKLALDGIEPDGIVFKDQLHYLVRGHFRFLREQVGFKLAELLKARLAAPPEAREFLFGDDWESDALIYTLYADLVAGRIDPHTLTTVLARLRVDPARLSEIEALSARLVPADVVRRIFIKLERRTPPGRFRSFGARLVPTFNYFQTAAVLYQEGMIPPAAVAEVGRALLVRAKVRPEHLRNALDDVVRRGHLGARAAARLRPELAAAGVLPALGERASWWERARWRRGEHAPAPVVARVDHARLVESWLARGGASGA